MTQDPNTSNIDQKSGYGVEELQVVGEQLLSKVKELLHEGNVRRIIIRHQDTTILEIPLTIGVAGVAIAPVVAAIGVLGALLTECSIQVVRTDTDPYNIDFTKQDRGYTGSVPGSGPATGPRADSDPSNF
jgi:xanthosine utilization system XapX-like protein